MSFEQRGRPVSTDARHGGKRERPPMQAVLSAKQKKHLQSQRSWQHGQPADKPADKRADKRADKSQAPAGMHGAGSEPRSSKT